MEVIYFISKRGRASHTWSTLLDEPAKIRELLDAPETFARADFEAGFSLYYGSSEPAFGTLSINSR